MKKEIIEDIIANSNLDLTRLDIIISEMFGRLESIKENWSKHIKGKSAEEVRELIDNVNYDRDILSYLVAYRVMRWGC